MKQIAGRKKKWVVDEATVEGLKKNRMEPRESQAVTVLLVWDTVLC